MLLALDVGNTQMVLGLFEGRDLRAHFRVSTPKEGTGDEFAVLISDLLGLKDLRLTDVTALVLSSVVPSATAAAQEMAASFFGADPLVIGPGVKTGLVIAYDNPHEVGADRIADAVGAFDKHGGPVVVVDFGTATTYDVISEKGEYLGGAISPGIETAADSLFSMAARLSRIDLAAPDRVIGKNTRASLQSGIVLGAASSVDGMIGRIATETGWKDFPVVATGGLCELIGPQAKSVTAIDPLLTLTGLQLIYERNQ